MVKVGLRKANMPTDEEQAVLAEFIMKYYGNYTTEQISEAFDLAITGQLPINDSGCYENFSCEYFGRIMAGYRAYLINAGRVQKNTDIERHRRQEPAIQLPPPPADWWPHVLAIKNEIVAGKRPKILPTAIYDYLLKAGRITVPAEQFVANARAAVLARLAEEKHDAKQAGKSINDILADIEASKSGTTTARIQAESKRMAIIHYVEQLIENERATSKTRKE